MGTKIIICDCKHEYQDKLYGKNHRVANKRVTKDRDEYRCTVCSKVK